MNTAQPTVKKGITKFWIFFILLIMIIIVLVGIIAHTFTKREKNKALYEANGKVVINKKEIALMACHNAETMFPKASNDTDNRVSSSVLPSDSANTAVTTAALAQQNKIVLNSAEESNTVKK